MKKKKKKCEKMEKMEKMQKVVKFWQLCFNKEKLWHQSRYFSMIMWIVVDAFITHVSSQEIEFNFEQQHANYDGINWWNQAINLQINVGTPEQQFRVCLKLQYCRVFYNP